MKQALTRAEAFRVLAGDDPRPLLVLRECLSCSGTDDALLSRSEDNERTLLFSRWFHCVKLPPDVLAPDHPFHVLFADKSPPHLFVSDARGGDLIALEGDQSRTELWSCMEKVLDREYEKDPGRALKRLAKLLGEYDVLDDRIARLKDRFEETIEDKGPHSPKLKKIQRDLTRAEEELAELLEEEAQASELELRPAAPAADVPERAAGSRET